MGGYGSGRTGGKGKAEHYRNLDVNRLHREGLLKPGRCSSWQWLVDGERVASISMQAETGRLVLNYRIKTNGIDWQDIAEPVVLTDTPCPYGGSRPWFLCPGSRNGRWCARRVGKLYLGQRYFLCRQCLRLAYACQSEERHYRTMRQADKRRVALGGEPGTAALPPRKPKGMHWKTYIRVMDAIDTYDAMGDMAFVAWVGRRFPNMPIREFLP